MKALYAYCQSSKQSHYQALLAHQQGLQLEKVVVGLILQIREIHPGMGLRTRYTFYQPADIGRDAFIELAYGFRVKSFRNASRTTFSSPYSRYPNLLVNKVLTDIDQPQLQTQLKRAVTTYNQQKPHAALCGLTPLAFEQHIKACPDE